MGVPQVGFGAASALFFKHVDVGRGAPHTRGLERAFVLLVPYMPYCLAEGLPVGLQIGAPATFKSYEDFFSKKMRKKICRHLENIFIFERVMEFKLSEVRQFVATQAGDGPHGNAHRRGQGGV